MQQKIDESLNLSAIWTILGLLEGQHMQYPVGINTRSIRTMKFLLLNS